MLHLEMVPVSEAAARQLVDSLLARGGPHAVDAAKAIVDGLKADRTRVSLTPEQRDEILGLAVDAMDDPPPGLAELYGELIRDARRRMTVEEMEVPLRGATWRWEKWREHPDYDDHEHCTYCYYARG